MSWRKGQRPNKRKWLKVRVKALDRDGWKCVKCGRGGRLEVDHIKPLHVAPEQDPFDLAGLQSLCRGCHIRKTAAENHAARPVDPNVAEWRALIAARLGE